MEWSSLLLIAVTSFGASMLTFFSGFGLGTILMPVFALFFTLPEAIALTAIVHLLNNLFKVALVYTHIDKGTLVRFGIAAVPFAFAGAVALSYLNAAPFFEGSFYRFSWLKISIGILLIFFSLFDLIPALSKLSMDKKYLTLGGAISGFFGGLSGHQGALRSAFLIKLGLSKQSFIATGIALACLIDVCRLLIYGSVIGGLKMDNSNAILLAIAVLSAFAGAYLGNRFLNKINISWLQKLVGALLILYGILMILGIL